jgi:DNA-binding sugar fermentation-stimulating protein
MIPQAYVVSKQLEEQREAMFQAESKLVEAKIRTMLNTNQSTCYVDSMSARMDKHLTELGYIVKSHSGRNETTYSISINS